MKTTSTDRMRRLRRRRRFGIAFVQVEMPLEAIELLAKRGYLLTRTPASMGLAITALLSDLVLDAAKARLTCSMVSSPFEDEDPGSNATTKSPWPTSRSRRSRITSRAGSQRWRLERRWRRPIRMPARARRRRLGLRVVHVEISEDAAEAEKRPVD